MSESIDSIREQLWQKMRKKPYRDNFVAAHLSTNLAAQIQTLREARGWTQKQLGEKAGMSQARISIMEDPSYDKFTISTARRLASAFDVAFIARFAGFSELVNWVADISPEKLEAPSFTDDSLARPSIEKTQLQKAPQELPTAECALSINAESKGTEAQPTRASLARLGPSAPRAIEYPLPPGQRSQPQELSTYGQAA